MEKVSFVIPIFNEEENIGELCSRITTVMDSTAYSYESMLFNDGSTDGSWIKRK